MDGLTHPVGDQPSSVYWKRRLFVIVGIVILALFVWWAISALGGDSATPGGSNSPAPTVSPSGDSTVSADPSRPCTAADFSVVATVPDTVKATTAPTFTTVLTSTATSPCIVDPTADSKIVVRSGDDQWFDSSKCTDYDVFNAEPFMLDVGGTHELTASWNYGRDDAGCTADLVAAKAGTYKVKVTVGGVTADEATFAVSK